MKALGSILVLAFLAVIFGAATNTFLLMQATTAAIELLRPPPADEEEEKELEVPGFWSFRTREIDNLITSLENRRVRLDEREKKIKELEDYVSTEKKELAEGKDEINRLKTELESHVKDLKLEEEENMKELGVMYTNLPPETTVEVFREMDDGFVLRILTQMESDVVSGIFQAMADQDDEPEFGIKRVVRLTEMLRLVQK